MKNEDLEVTANKLFISGIDHNKKGDRERAKRCFAYSWGINRYLENVDLMNMCYVWLRRACLSNREADEWKNRGYDFVLGVMSLPDRVGRELGR